ncbi:TetR/AcrR family transcriptional regulator [Microbulbifer halophilus]|uniref:TetR/AcrR family transcriptional regulator n=1 Tax=Microbulbifer halophilus TaxID=453963 RepID=A0ABW5EDL6_9GAMM|nr:TetR/AcrR family transcriptional regulator [Microbulbifer halophilus]MCW8127119.1 TetR/AcrR family transcriptional regulator [Microbulbifer halophilus]
MSKVDKDSIIRAAEDVVRERGARKLTLDAVAEKCGLSKGGLLHHFRTKQSLLKAMLEAATARESELTAEFVAAGCGAAGGTLYARIESLFTLMEDDESLPRSLIAAVAEDPALLEPIKTREALIRREVCESSSDPELAQLLLYAARGLFLGRVLNVMEPDDPVYERLHARLLELCADID